MKRNRVILFVQGIGLVVASGDTELNLETRQHPRRQARVVAMQNPKLPRPHEALKHRREAVKRHQHGCIFARRTTVKFGGNRAMIGLIDLALSCSHVFSNQTQIARDIDPVADNGN